MIEQARCDLESPSREVRGDARWWIESAESEYVFSFISVCNLLDFNHDAVRERLLRQRHRAVFAKTG